MLDIAKYSDTWPQVAQVVTLGSEDCQIKWYKGAVSARQVLWVLLTKGHGRGPWLETVNRNVIWHYGLVLTKGTFLPVEIERLTKQYANDM